MVTADVVFEWLTCMANFLYPFLVLLEEPLYFMVGIQLFTLLNVAVAKRQMRTSRNNFVLSLYPLLFHLCFWIFCFCESNTVLVYTEITCMVILVLGCLHNSLTMIITILYYSVSYLKYLCSKNGEKGSIKNKPVAKFKDVWNYLSGFFKSKSNQVSDGKEKGEKKKKRKKGKDKSPKKTKKDR